MHLFPIQVALFVLKIFSYGLPLLSLLDVGRRPAGIHSRFDFLRHLSVGLGDLGVWCVLKHRFIITAGILSLDALWNDYIKELI